MAENQNPVFTDNETVLGDGTVEQPLSASPSTMQLLDAMNSVPATPLALPDGVETTVWETRNLSALQNQGIAFVEFFGQLALTAAITKAHVRVYFDVVTPDNLEFEQEWDFDNTGPILTNMILAAKGASGLGTHLFVTVTVTGDDTTIKNYWAGALYCRTIPT